MKAKKLKAKRCRSCGRWVKPDILGMCQCHWACYHCGGPAPTWP
jgi:hypothetical protein